MKRNPHPRSLFIVVVVILSCVGFFILVSCGGETRDSRQTRPLYVLHAGSLSVPFKEIALVFQEEHPQVKVLLEAHGSRTCARHIRDLGKEVDLFGSADSGVIKNLLIPDYAEFVLDFARNEMVLAYLNRSKYSTIIQQDNWYEILLKDGVNIGHSDPNADPCGYRAVLTCKLAEKFYRKKGFYRKLKDKIPLRNIRPKEVDLLALLESGELDYIFIYKSVAIQHHLNFLSLPPQINLSSLEYRDFYQSVSTSITGKKPGETILKRGSPMVYGITIPKNAPQQGLAIRFLNFILSRRGRDIMEKNGQVVIYPVSGYRLEFLPPGIILD